MGDGRSGMPDTSLSSSSGTGGSALGMGAGRGQGPMSRDEASQKKHPKRNRYVRGVCDSERVCTSITTLKVCNDIKICPKINIPSTCPDLVNRCGNC